MKFNCPHCAQSIELIVDESMKIKQLTEENAELKKQLSEVPKIAPEVLLQAKKIVARWRAEADAVQDDIVEFLKNEGESDDDSN